MSGELLSTKYPVLMKIFLPEMNKRRKGKIYEVISGGRIVNENFIKCGPSFYRRSLAVCVSPG